MIEVFIRVAPQYLIRKSMAEAVLARWLQEPNVRIRIISAGGSYANLNLLAFFPDIEILPIENFAWESRRYAERVAAGDRYILADDDHMILGTQWAERAWNVMEANQDYGILAARSVIAAERFGGSDTEVIDHPYVGCPCIIRKVGLTNYETLNSPANQQDELMCDKMRRLGLKTGFIRGLDYNHLGHGFSQVEPLLWMRY